MNQSAVAEISGSPPGLDNLDNDGSESEHSTATAHTAKLSVGACPIGTSCPSEDINIETGPESPWEEYAPDAEKTDQRGGGSYVLLTGNWGHLVQKHTVSHRSEDLLREPCHILALQEADADLCRTLTGGASISERAAAPSREDRQQRRYIAILGALAPGDNTSLLFAVRTSLFSGLKILLYDRTVEARRRRTSKTGSVRMVPKVNKMMVANFVKRFHDRGGGADDVVVLNVHLNNCIAKKDVQGDAEALHRFWERMCHYIMKYKVRFLVGDFNLALWIVIPEMRARGMLINLLAWQPWNVQDARRGGSCVRCDTIGIFAIGGCMSIRLPFDC